jgi:hypothetical protein
LFGSQVGFKHASIIGALILLTPLMFYLLAARQQYILKKHYSQSTIIDARANASILFNTGIVVFLLIIHFTDSIILWKSQFVNINPAHPKETVYYRLPIMGLIGMVLILLNWNIANLSFSSSKKITKAVAIISLSTLITFFTIWTTVCEDPYLFFDKG